MGQVLIICAICDHLYRNVKINFNAHHCEHLVDKVLQVGQIAAVFNGLRQRDLPGVKSGAKAWSDYRIR